MFNSVVLDVVTGLVFIYLLYSMLATIIQEIIASFFDFRAKILERAVFRMLEDETKFNYRISSIFYLFKKKGNGGAPNTASFGFYSHPLIRFLGDNKPNSKPAYIDKETFSKVLIDLLRGDKVKPGDDIQKLIQRALDNKTVRWGKVSAQISEETLSYINSIWADAQGDVEKFKNYLENWFDATMERASGWYKKHTQFILFFVGIAIAVIFNVDTIKIVGKLEKDPKLREQIVQQADAFLIAHPDLNKELIIKKTEFDTLNARTKRNNIILTDSVRKLKNSYSSDIANYKALAEYHKKLADRADSILNTDIKKTNEVLGLGWGTYECESCGFVCFLLSLLGWVITALAISLGAPFWFDLLNKLMKLRNSITSSSSDEQRKSDSSQTPGIKRVG
jgi:hypothetical protein